ncbi:MAG: ribonuclease HI [Nitrospinae bacterium]|nr:ribonuclease HI [Nitrospinota bacterium]
MKQVEIFSDGSCIGNPGPGGWGSIVRCDGTEAELSGGKKQTTNNEMELTGVIEGLRSLTEPSAVTVTTDSQYVVKGMTEWMPGWIRNGWKTASKQPVKNRQHWEALNALSKTHTIKWRWIRGHAGHAENERCDRLATAQSARHR